MRNRKYWFWNMIILFLCLSFLSGCRSVPKSKTLLLPKEDMEQQGVALEGEEGDNYVVRKMYSKEYESLMYGGFTAFLPGTEEHKVRLAESGMEGLKVQTLDYRYGFYDTGLFPVGELMDGFGLISAWNYRDGRKLQTEFFSPDGRYLLYMRGDLPNTGMQLYMMDLETEKEELLLDAEAAKCPGNQYMILAAWSRDASLLCYGFYPKFADVWNAGKGDRFMLYHRDMETGEIVSSLNYYDAGAAGRTQDLQGTMLYVDRDGKDILTAIVSEREDDGKNASSEQVCATLFLQKIPASGQEAESVATPSVVNCPRDTKLYLDVKGGTLYFTSRHERILGFNVEDGTSVSMVPSKTTMEIHEFCVLDGGEAFVTAEYDRGYKDGILFQDICLYTRTEEGMTRRVLYQNAGYVIRLQYDPVYRRLLAETGEPYEAEEADSGKAAYVQWTESRRALVLEF